MDFLFTCSDIFDAGMWSRSRYGLETYQRLVSTKVPNVSVSSWSRTSASRILSRSRPKTSRVSIISSRRDVSCMRAQLNYNSPLKTSRPMAYSVGRVLRTVCLDGYCLINNVFILFTAYSYSYSVPRKRLAMLFLKVSKLRNKYAVWPRKKVSRYYCNNYVYCQPTFIIFNKYRL